MVEQLNVHPDVIEAQLAHGKSGPLGAAFDRAEFVAQRCAIDERMGRLPSVGARPGECAIKQNTQDVQTRARRSL